MQNTIEIRATASEIAAPKTRSRRQNEKKTILKHFLKGKLVSPKLRKFADMTNQSRSLDPIQYDLRFSAAKDNSITHAATAPSNLDATTPMRSAEIELQNTIELHAMASEIAAPKPDLHAKATKRRFRSTF